LALCAILGLAVGASAQPVPGATPKASAQPSAAASAPASATAAPAAAEEDKQVSEETKADAKKHFQRGIELLRQEAWAPALAEFLVSRQLYATRVATNNAAFALRKLERYDEALDMYETLLRDFQVADKDRQSAQSQLAELRGLVGTIDISSAVPGASIVVSSQDRGEYPPIKPIRVAAGNHVVRVFKEGYEPFETRIDVAGGELVEVKAKMAKLKDSGRLRVVEQSGRSVDVIVDNVTMGQTPWEGVLGVGMHVVLLRGEGKLGSQPIAAPVKSGAVTALPLLAESLDAQLRVNPTPPGATVAIDRVDVGRGVWLGRLKVGGHKIEVRAEGFLTTTREMALAKGQRELVDISLDRDEEAPVWRLPSKWVLDVGASLLIVPTFGGNVAGGCDGSCSKAVGLGGLGLLSGSYELGSGLGFGLEAGYLIATQTVSQRTSTVLPNGMQSETLGTAEDSLRLQSFVGGASIGYHMGTDYPFHLKLGAGVVVGQMRDERSGTYNAQHGGVFEASPMADFQAATYFYVDPTIRAGVRFADNFELTGSVQVLMMIGISPPKWDKTLELAAGSDGVATYPADQLMGGFVIAIAPGLDLRYDY